MNDRKSKIVTGLPAVVFMILIGAVSIITAVSPKAQVSTEENRELQGLPELSGEDVLNGEFQNSYESYMSDQFICRSSLTELKSMLVRSIGRRDINGIYLGNEGYYIEKYTEDDFDGELVDENIEYLSEYLAAAIGKYGADNVHCMLVPSKGSVLTDKLPAYAEEYDSSWLGNRIKDSIKSDLKGETRENMKSESVRPENMSGEVATDLETVLKAHSDEYIYYRTDHHWTTLGAYYAYKEYCRMCGFSESSVSEYTQTTVTGDFHGSSYDKVQLPCAGDEIVRWDKTGAKNDIALYVQNDESTERYNSFYDESALAGKDKYRYFLGGNEANVHIHTQAGNGRTLFLIKDSYSNCFVEFLAGDYEDIYMTDLRYTNDMIEDIMEDIETENPIDDILVMYNREKFMRDNNLWQLEPSEEGWTEDVDSEDTDSDTDDTEEPEDDDFEEENIF